MNLIPCKCGRKPKLQIITGNMGTGYKYGCAHCNKYTLLNLNPMNIPAKAKERAADEWNEIAKQEKKR